MLRNTIHLALFWNVEVLSSLCYTLRLNPFPNLLVRATF